MAPSIGAAVQVACLAVGAKLLKAAGKVEGNPFGGATADDVSFEAGHIVLNSDRSTRVSYVEAMRAAGHAQIEAEETASGGLSGMISQMQKSQNTHSAIFAEVKVDEELGVVRVTRIVNSVAAGRIIIPRLPEARY